MGRIRSMVGSMARRLRLRSNNLREYFSPTRMSGCFWLLRKNTQVLWKNTQVVHLCVLEQSLPRREIFDTKLQSNLQ